MSPPPTPHLTLRWIYANREHRFLCELSLDNSDSVYELRTAALSDAAHTKVEQFADATPAFLRHEQIERSLIESGWTLDFFERRHPTLH